MKSFAAIMLIIALVAGIVCFEAWLGMVIFNWVMGLFNCSFTLTFWQAFGVCVLLSFVGSFFKSSSKSN
jgi:hypothetical protein